MKKTMKIALALSPIYLAGLYLFTLGFLCSVQQKTPRINSEQQLIRMLEDEKSVLGCNKKISAKFYDGGSCATKNKDNSYVISLNKSDGNNIGSLRHELYHIYAGHCESNGQEVYGLVGVISYLLKEEPAACIYGVWSKDCSKLFTKSKKSNLTKIKDSKVVENMEEVRGEGK